MIETSDHFAPASARLPAAGPVTVKARRRGPAAVTIGWLRWSAPWGLVSWQREVRVDHGVAILPDVSAAKSLALKLFRRDADWGATPTRRKGAGGEFESMVEFQPGMDRRRIDWKVSARHAKLLARDYEIERNTDVVLAIDAGRLMGEPVDGLPRLDRVSSAALALGYAALRLGDKVRIFGFDSHPCVSSGPLGGPQAFAQLQHYAAQLDYSTAESNFTLALSSLAAGLKRRSLILIFTEFTDPAGAELMLAALGPLIQRHLVLFVVLRDEELDALIAKTPETADDIVSAVVAGELAQQRRLIIAKLRRLGVRVLETRYQAISAAVVNAYLDIKQRDLV